MKNNWFKVEKILTPEDIFNMITLNQDTEQMFWLHRDRKWFSSDISYKRWNTRFEGHECFKYVTVQGYLRGSLLGFKCPKHRVCWVFYYGEWPKGLIDHKDGDKTNNRQDNLRIVDHKGNARNQRQRDSNTSGYNGVYRAKREGAWRAGVNLSSGYKSLGVFNKIEDAVKAREDANKGLNFYERHGKRRNT